MEENINRYVVVDASAVLSFLLKENNIFEGVFTKFKEDGLELFSTALLRYEVGNGLKMAVTRKRVSDSDVQNLYGEFLNYGIKEKEVDLNQSLQICLLENLTFYDASYLALAKNLSCPLLTLDKKLKKLL